MAEELNTAGYRTPRDRPFTAESVRQLLARVGPDGAKRKKQADRHKPTRSPGADSAL